jgi:hypothetical protein
MSDDFSDVGMGVGVKPFNQAAGQLLPEQMDHGVGAVYDRVIRAGGTPAQAEEEVRKSVYGVNYKLDKSGRPIQQGVGAWPHHVTSNHLNAIRKWEGEISYQNALKKLWRDAPDRARAIDAPEPTRASA